jgi:hypothetical protein
MQAGRKGRQVRLGDVHPGTVVRLESGQIVVAAVGPGHGCRYVMQETGDVLDTQAGQEVEIVDVAWSSRLAPLLIRRGVGREAQEETV